MPIQNVWKTRYKILYLILLILITPLMGSPLNTKNHLFDSLNNHREDRIEGLDSSLLPSQSTINHEKHQNSIQELSKNQQTRKSLNTEQNGATVSFIVGLQSSDTLQNMIDDFNTLPAYDFTVQLQTMGDWAGPGHDLLVTELQAQNDSFDVFSMDIFWSPDFAAAGFLEPLDNIFPVSEQEKFLDAPIEAGTFNGSIYGIPWFHDSGLLYYRTDIVEYAFNESIIPENRPPQTWAELHDWTLDMLNDPQLVAKYNGSDGILKGFIWQGMTYEGLICDFMEYLGGTGVYSFLNNGQSAPQFDNQSVEDALQFMKSLLDDGVSPPEVVTYHEETSRAVWNAGNAIFHRNWPYTYKLSLLSTALNGTDTGTNEPLFNVTVMPSQAGAINPRTSCLGGWQLGLNKFSNYKNEAKQFMSWLTAPEQQKTYLLGNGNLPSREAVYTDSEVLSSELSYVKDFLPFFQKAIPRPIHPKYENMSQIIQPTLNSYLSGTISLNEAIEQMNYDVNLLLGPQTYVPHSRVTIFSNSQFSYQGFQGTGTSDEPYRIEGLNITDSGGDLISISGTTAYFRIANCLLNGLGTTGNGIYLDNVIHGSLMNNTIFNNGWSGVNVARRSDFNIVANNTIFGNSEDGIRLGEGTPSHNNTLYNNTIHDNGWRGIAVDASKNNTIGYNQIYNSGSHAIDVYSSSGNTQIISNTIYNYDNTGIGIGGDAGPTSIYGNIIYMTVPTRNRWGINLGGSDNNNVSYNTVYNTEFALDLRDSSNCNITDNTIHNNINGIITGGNTNENTISWNLLYNNEAGVSLNSGGNTISFNLFYDNDWGLRIETNDVVGNIVTKNDLANNTAQATDEGSNTVFSENYWSDWIGTGAYVVYTIDGSIGNQDPSPAINSFHLSAPIITAPTMDSIPLVGDVIIQWTPSSDSFGHSFTYSFLYSVNNGETWITLVTGLTTTTYTLDTTTITDGMILLKIQAVDTVGCVSQTFSTVSFLIDNDQLTVPTILSPNGGETLTGSATLTWTTAYYSVDHSITYTVYYSGDEGATWTEIASELTSTSYSWDTTEVSNGFSYLIKVVATCSEGYSVEDVSDDTFAIQNGLETSTTMTTTSTQGSVTSSGMTVFMFVCTLGVLIIARKRRES
ncbi:MAG: extracellular solute-binding protein [Candidatus Thorarchaeota archaeon]